MKAGLRCIACGKYLGDNNAHITTGPLMGARPTDLTQFCELTGKQEAVIDTAGHLEAVATLSKEMSKGTALRVGNEIWVPRNSTEADREAAMAMMTDAERKCAARRTVRDLKWTVWRMKHPRWAALLDHAYLLGMSLVGGRVR